MLSDNRLVRLLRHLADRLGADGCANGGVREHGYSPSGLPQGAVKIPLRLIRGNAQGRQSRLGINFRRVRDSRGSAIDGLAVTLDVIQDVDRATDKLDDSDRHRIGVVAGGTDVDERFDPHDRIDTDVTVPTSKDCPVIIGGAAAGLDYGNRSFGSSSSRPLTKAQAKHRLAFIAHPSIAAISSPPCLLSGKKTLVGPIL